MALPRNLGPRWSVRLQLGGSLPQLAVCRHGLHDLLENDSGSAEVFERGNMHQVLMGAVSAVAFGIADFMGSQSGLRLGALRGLAGMLLVSTVVLTVYGWSTGAIWNAAGPGIWIAALHGILMSYALLLFFHAMTIGPINVVAPIIAAHPVFILLFALATGSRPGTIQFLAMAGIILGVIIVGAVGYVTSHPEKSDVNTKRLNASVLVCALLASVVYAGAIIAAQNAAPLNDEIVTLWLGRLFGLGAVLVVFPVTKERLTLPVRWWPFFCLHGVLDSVGLLFLLRGSGGSYDEVTAVVASTFSVITVVLAWIILGERMTRLQGLGIVLIFACVAVLAFGG